MATILDTKTYLFIFFLISGFWGINAQKAIYNNPELTPEERAADLISRLTLEEKISLMMDDSPAIPRLGIPKYNWWNEALHGVGRAGLATVFPQSIGMAATFDPDAIEETFTIVSDEARAKYNYFRNKGENDRYKGLTFWTPNINIFRDPRWGRGQETYGEDPYLTSRMGKAIVRGLQGDKTKHHLKTLAGAKHFAVHSGPEWNRHSFDANNIFPEDLWSTYLPAFKALVDEGVGQVMCAYNRFEGKPCCGNEKLLTQILRNEWGYQGIIVTDCWALDDFYRPGRHGTHKNETETGADAVRAGTDLECGPVFNNLIEAVDKGLIEESKIDQSLMRLLSARFALGEMDETNDNEWSNLTTDIIVSPGHKDKALEIARKSMTLLKNNGILPLKKNESIIVMGPNAMDSIMPLGNYNGTPEHTVTILEGIKSKIPDIKYFYGCDLIIETDSRSAFNLLTYDNKPGIIGYYWNEVSSELNKPVSIQTYTHPLNLHTEGATVFAPNVNLENFKAKYEGIFSPSKTEEYKIKIKKEESGELIVKVNGCQLNPENSADKESIYYPFKAVKGKEYNIELTYSHYHGDANLVFDLIREAEPEKMPDNFDTVIFVGGISPEVEGEEMPVNLPGFKGGDRTSIELPQIQRNFLKELKSKGKKIILVNCSGSAIALSTEDSICDAILQAWYPGQAGGTAVADVLFGDYNPAGRLPVTFYRNDAQLPDYEDYDMEGRTYRYMEESPLYSFGFGLSYSTFKYSDANLTTPTGSKDLAVFNVKILNESDLDGDEVIQIYIKKKDETGGPKKTLREFKRIHIPAHQEKEVSISLEPETFLTYNRESQRLEIMPGEYYIYYGSNSDCKDYLIHEIK